MLGSLMCLAGCATPLTFPTQAPQSIAPTPGGAGSAAAPPVTATAPTHRPSFAAAPASGVQAGPSAFTATHSGVTQVNHATTAAPQADATNRPYVARQVPVRPGPGPGPGQPGFNFTPPQGPPLPPGSEYSVPNTTPPILNTDPYGPLIPRGPRVREADLIINGFPARTGRIMLGGAVNSDAGLTGQLTIDERNFDITRWPRSFRDLFSGTAFRGAGQTFRVEAAPGTDFKRYTIQFADPNIFGYKPVSLSVSGFLYDRRFDDWDEERLGGRVAFGYRVTPDLSVAFGVGGQNVDITRPRIRNVQPLEDVLGNNEFYTGDVTLRHDTRDTPIQPAEGHYFEFKYEKAFGKFDYSRFELECRRYWLITERADRTGRQTISYSTQLGFSGDETPIFENFFAGGYSTIRGFDFRGASPVIGGVQVGGQFQWLNTVEYMFPITADDAFRGVAFVDFGTVEQDIKLTEENFRVAPGLGLRVAIPMLGPAPLAFDFAYPVAMADTDDRRIFSFYMSLIN